MNYLIESKPIAWKRAKPARRGNKIYMYDSQKDIKLLWGVVLSKQHKGPPLTGPLEIAITFFMPIPRSYNMKIKEGDYHCITPDGSNLLKLIEDAANGILYRDDCQLAVHHIQKIYSHNPRTEFALSQL